MDSNEKSNSVRSESPESVRVLDSKELSRRSSIVKIHHFTKSFQKFESPEISFQLPYKHQRVLSMSYFNSRMLYSAEHSDEDETRLPKDLEFMLRNLAKFPKMRLLTYYAKWRNRVNVKFTQKIFNMISLVNRIFLNKAKRVFRPPRVIKDADEIMKRTIKKLIQIKFRLFDSAFARWKYFKMAINVKEKAVVFYRACQQAGHIYRDAFYIWREKTLALQSIKRTAAVGKVNKVLHKCFRGRFKHVLFSTYLRTGPKKALSRIWVFLNKKYLENTRIAESTWKFFVSATRSRESQLSFIKILSNLFTNWKKINNFNLKRGLRSLTKDSRQLKLRMIRGLINAWMFKRNQCFDILKSTLNAPDPKYKAFRMQTALKRASRRFQKYGFSLFLPPLYPTGSLNSLTYLYLKRISLAFLKIRFTAKNNEIWTHKQVAKSLRVDLKKQKLRSRRLCVNNFQHSLQRLIGRKFTQIIRNYHGVNRVKVCVTEICESFNKRTRSIMRKWTRAVNQSKSTEARLEINGHKLISKLSNLVGSVNKIIFSVLSGARSKVKLAFATLIRNIEKRPRDAFIKWRKFNEMCTKREMLNAFNTEKLLNALRRISIRTTRRAFQITLGAGNQVKGALQVVTRNIEKKRRLVFMKWNKTVVEIKQGHLFDACRTGKLRNSFHKLPLKTLRTVLLKIFGQGNRGKGALKNIFRIYNNFVRISFNKWKDFLKQCLNLTFFNMLRSEKLSKTLSRLTSRTLRSTYTRILGDGSSAKGVLKSLFILHDKKLQSFLQKWIKFTEACKTKLIFDNQRRLSLKNSLIQLSKMRINSYLALIIGINEKKVKRVLSYIIFNISQRPQRALNMWKFFVLGCKTKVVLDNFKSQRLMLVLRKVPQRVLRLAFDKVIGDGNRAKGVIQRIVFNVKNKVCLAFGNWKKFCGECRNKTIFDGFRSKRLKYCLTQILQGKLKNTVERIIGNGNLAKGALRKIFMRIAGLPRLALTQWRNFNRNCAQKLFIDNLNSLRLKSAMERILRKTSVFFFNKIASKLNSQRVRLMLMIFSLKYSLRNHFDKWKFSSKNSDRAQRIKGMLLRFSIMRPIQRIASRFYRKVSHRQILIKKDVKYLASLHRKKLVSVMFEWSLAVAKKQCEVQQKTSQAVQLKSIFSKIVAKRVKKGMDILVNSKFTFPVLRRLALTHSKIIRTALITWQQSISLTYINTSKNKLRAVSLKSSVQRASLKSLNSAFSRLTKINNHSIHALTNLSLLSSKVPRGSFNIWRSYLRKLDELSSLRKIRSEKLKFSLSKLIFRTVKQVAVKITHSQIIIRKFTRLFVQNYRLKHKTALSTWVKYVEKCKHGNLIDAVRREKLRKHLLNINRRHLRDSLERVIGNGNKIKGHLRRMMMQIQKTKLVKFQLWKASYMKDKIKEAEFMVKGLKVKAYLLKTCERNLRSSFDRILGNGGRAIGAIRRILTCIKIKYIQGFRDWKENTMLLKKRDEKRGNRVLHLMSKTALRISRNMIDSILGDIRKRTLIKKFVANYVEMERVAFSLLWSRVEKIRTIKKVNSAYSVFRSFVGYYKRILAIKFKFWKNLEYLRRRRILRKSIAIMIQNMSINFESGFWKWKFVLTKTGNQLNPRHSLFFRRFILTTSNFQRRLLQFSLFKLVLNYKSHNLTNNISLPKALARIFKSDDLSVPKHSPTSTDFSEIISASDNVPYKNKQIITQIGIFEVLFLQFRSVILRKYTWVFSSLFSHYKYTETSENEKSRLIEMISELRYEKHSLLEDNNILRIHNDSLIANLEKNTSSFQEITLTLDYMRITSMVRTLTRVSDIAMFYAFSKLSEH